MKQVVLWGSRKEYEVFSKFVEIEALKGSIKIIAFCMNDSDGLCYWDGIPICTPTDFIHMDCDYIINMNQTAQETIARLRDLLKIEEEKIIPISIFSNPCFDFSDYCTLIESKVSIIAAHCWGGICLSYARNEILFPVY